MNPAVMIKNRFLSKLRRDKAAMTGLAFMLLCLLTAVCAPILVMDKTNDANKQTVELQNRPPGFKQLFVCIGQSEIPICGYHISGNMLIIEKQIDESVTDEQRIPISEAGNFSVFEKSYLLGTDGLGRDMLSRLILGTRISLSIGVIAALVSLTVGLLLGMFAGYYKGKIDSFISWFINLNWAIPTLLLVFSITLLLGKGLGQIMLAIGLSMWVNVARLVRGQVMAIKEMEYIQAARMMGLGDYRIMIRHILPNITGPLIVITIANFATAIMLESGLSFLGIGLQPPMPSWGLMIRENYDLIITGKPLLAFIPGIAIALLVFSLNLSGNGIRDALDVKS